MANKIVDNTKPVYTITLNAGDLWKLKVPASPLGSKHEHFIIAHNKVHNAWNIVSLETGEFMFSKDIRATARVIEILTEHEAEPVTSLTLNSNQDLSIKSE